MAGISGNKEFSDREREKLFSNNSIFIYGEYQVIVRRSPIEKVLFKNVPFHVSDDELLKYMYSSPDIKVHTKHIIPTRLRNKKRELTPYLSGDRFLYVRGDFRRVLPSMISINNYKCRVMHQSQELACRRCQFLGHTVNNTAVCDDPIVISIRSPKTPYVIITFVTSIYMAKLSSQLNTMEIM